MITTTIKYVFTFLVVLALTISQSAFSQFYWPSRDDNYKSEIRRFNEGEATEVIYHFGDNVLMSDLLHVGNNLWGVEGLARDGEANYAVFKVGVDGSNYEVVKEFEHSVYGTLGYRLLEHDGKIWGLTEEGGVSDFVGTIFSIDTLDYSLDTYQLYPMEDIGFLDDHGGLIFYDGKLWGLATAITQLGILYSYDLQSGKLEGYSVGQSAFSDVKLINGSFWLMLINGGTYGNGSIAKFDPITKESKTVHYFETGKAPYGELTLANDKVWGVTKFGGIKGNTIDTYKGKGILFSMDLDGTNFEIAHKFDGELIFPVGTLVAKDCKLWGVADNSDPHKKPYIYNWDIETSTLTKQNEYSAIYHEPRNYQKLTFVGDSGDCSYKTITGIANSQNTPVSIYPNPAQDKINVNSSLKDQSLMYEIVTMAGIPVQYGVVENSMINISQLSSGIYHLLIKNNSGAYSLKLAKN